MRRFWAAAIDFILSYVLGVVLFCMILSLWKVVRIMLGNEWESDVRFLAVICLLLMSLFLASLLYLIAAPYYLMKGRMFYDEILNLGSF